MDDPWSELQDALHDLDTDVADRSHLIDATRNAATEKRYGTLSEDEFPCSFSAQLTQAHSREREGGTRKTSTKRADDLSLKPMTAAPLAPEANTFTATLPLRPAWDQIDGVTAGPVPSKRPSPKNPLSANRTCQSLEAALDSAAPSESLGQRVSLQSATDDGLPRDEMGDRRTPRNTRERAIPSDQLGQTALLSRPNDDALPIAVETPKFDAHVKR
jgi:hypothetical protein